MSHSIVGLLPFMIILITASLSSNTYNKASWWEDWDVWGNKISIIQFIDQSLKLLAFVNHVRWRTNFTFDALFETVLIRVSKNCNDQISKVKSGNTIQPQSCIQGNDFWFCWAVRNWSLFLAHPTSWYKCLTSKNAQCFTRSRFWVLKISRKIGVLKQSQPALFGSITHMTILFVFTCAMDVRY